MDFRTLPMNKSPFHDEKLSDGNLDKRKTVRFTNYEFDRLNTYFENNDMEFSQGIRSLCYDKLDTICNERKTFNNLEVIMLIPKVNKDKIDLSDVESAVKEYYHILDTYSEIIAVINTECDFKRDFNHLRKFNDDYNLVYEAKEFNQKNFPMHILQNTKESKVYRTNQSTLNSFHSFKDRQSELYPNLNVDDCYFVRFPLNNYLDEFRSGQFQQIVFSNYHEGAFVFEIEIGLKYYCFIDWSYFRDTDSISFEFCFSSQDDFSNEIFKSTDVKLIKAAFHVVNGEYGKERLKVIKSELLSQIETIDEMLEDYSKE